MRLIDEAAIRNVLARYARGIDRRDRSLVAGVYWEDALDRHAIFEGGAREFVDWVFDFLAADLGTTHMIGQSLIEVCGNEAAAETYYLAHRLRSTAHSKQLFVSGGRYAHTFQKRTEEWRILRCDLLIDWTRRIDDVAGSLQVEDLLDPQAIGQPSPADRSYTVFRSLTARR